MLHIPPQTPTAGGVTYTNEGGKVKVTATATGITATCTGAFSCGLGGIPTHSNESAYTGTVVLTGYEDLNGGESEGEQLSIAVKT